MCIVDGFLEILKAFFFFLKSEGSDSNNERIVRC